MFRSLRSLILLGAMAVSFVVFFGVYFFVSHNHKQQLFENSAATSEAISVQTFSAMYQVMSKGWTREELVAFVRSANEAFFDTPFSLEIFRGQKVDDLYGTIDQPTMDTAVKSAFGSGEMAVIESGPNIRYIYPIVADTACLSCHHNAANGDVMGVIEVRQDMAPMLEEINQGLWLSLLLIVPLPILAAFWVSGLLSRKIDRSMGAFRDRITQVNKVRDLHEFEVEKTDLGFTELNQVFDETFKLVERLKDVAADKDILEFEVKVLEKFVITSDVVKDWKAYVRDLLIEINTVIDAYALFAIFRIDEELYELEIFWYHTPDENSKKLFEQMLRDKVASNPYFSDFTHLRINHNIADSTQNLPPISDDDVDLQTKTLMLDTPKIGGVVGIGVQSILSRDQTRFIVIDSILTTLINVVGSIKAIYKYTQDLEYYATRDPLTHLYNQRIYWEMLDYEVKRAHAHGYAFATLVIDFDNFKVINDKHGHQFGDEFLRAFSKKLRGALREGDVLCRYGGDEFTIILPETSADQASLVAQAIETEIASLELMAPDGEAIRTTLSIGVAVYPKHAESAKELFIVADNMMYKAKSHGKDSIMMPEPGEVDEIFEEMGQKSQMVMAAIENRSVIAHFQPIIDVRSGEVSIHELLMRINDAGRTVPASEFVDIAETLGVIHKLDYILIEMAFEKMRDENYQGVMFINLSPRSLIIGEFIGSVTRMAETYGIDKSKVVFELTERDTVKNLGLLEQFVYNLRSQGFKFAIDDFGSGFSSFHYIKKFPIDYIKVEGEFIKNMVTDSVDRAFVNSIISLAQDLNIKTVGEFVEDAEVMEKVKTSGLDYAQGFYIGRPGPDFRVDNPD